MADDTSIPIFTEEYLTALHTRFANQNPFVVVSEEQLLAALTLSVDTAIAQIQLGWPAGSTTTKICNMPPKHAYSGASKTCSNCRFSYCLTHAMNNCGNCGQKL